MADLSIYAPFLRRPKTVDEYDAEARRAQLDDLALLEAQDKRAVLTRQRQRADQLRQLMAGMPGATDEQRVQALRGGAFFDEADALEKGIGERAKTRATVDETNAKTDRAKYDLGRQRFEHRVTGLRAFDSPEDARQWLADGVTRGDMTMQEATGMMRQVPQDPGQFGGWRDQTVMALLDAGKQMGYVMPDANTVATRKSVEGVAAADRLSREREAAAGRAVTMRGQNMTDARAREAHAAAVSKPFEVTDPETGQPTLVLQSRDGGISRVAGWQPKGMGTTKLTEDQGKATGWLSQATNAYGNMMAALETTPSAARPGFNDALAAVPSFGIGEALGNAMRGTDRQKYLQGVSSLSEALLRAATGAGVNKDEAAQKVRELTPQFGDSAEVIQQKMDAIPVYIESLKVRAGPGAKQVPGIMERAGKPGAGGGSGFRLVGVEGGK